MVDVTVWRQLADRFRTVVADNPLHFRAEWNVSADPRWSIPWKFGTEDEQFKRLARLAEMKAGGHSDGEAWLNWLDRVARDSDEFKKFPLKSPTDQVYAVAERCAVFCEQLADDTEIRQLSNGPLARVDTTPEQFASDLWEAMAARGLTVNRLHVLSGIDRQTIRKVLDGKAVHPLKREQLKRAIETIVNNNHQPSQ